MDVALEKFHVAALTIGDTHQTSVSFRVGHMNIGGRQDHRAVHAAWADTGYCDVLAVTEAGRISTSGRTAEPFASPNGRLLGVSKGAQDLGGHGVLTVADQESDLPLTVTPRTSEMTGIDHPSDCLLVDVMHGEDLIAHVLTVYNPLHGNPERNDFTRMTRNLQEAAASAPEGHPMRDF